MSGVTMVSSSHQDFNCITAMLAEQDSVILAAKLHPSFFDTLFGNDCKIYMYGPEETLRLLHYDSYTNIPDITKIRCNRFAFIDQGNIFYSTINQMEISTNVLNTGYIVHSFSTDAHCSGLSFVDNHYFLTYSKSPGYVKMLDQYGNIKAKFSSDSYGMDIFSSSLAKIHVTPGFKIYVSDTGKKQLTVLRFSPTDWSTSIKAEYDMTVKSIIRKGENDVFIAVDGWNNGILLLTPDGPRRVVKKDQIYGTITAMCLVGEALYVATSSGWFPQRTRISVFKDRENIREEDRLISK